MANPKRFPHDRQADALSEFQAARARYIEEYASLEQALSGIFGHLSDTTDLVAGVIFFRISSARSRLTIIDRLMRIKYGDEHRAFFNSLIKNLKVVDSRRNEVVHWLAVHVLGDEGNYYALYPPNIWDLGDDSPNLHAGDLDERSAECSFYQRTLALFMTHLKGWRVEDAWLDIFRQPLAYPPPDTHPLSPNYRAPESPPRSSPA